MPEDRTAWRNPDGDGPGIAIVITGPVGAGKTTTAIALSERLEHIQVPHAMIDMDHLRWAWPAPPGDRFHARLGMRNLAAVSAAYREAGARVLVIADVVETPEDRAHYEHAIPGMRVVIVRLRVPPDLIAQRLHGRDTGDQLTWSLNRALELEGIMDAAGIGTAPGDLVVEVGAQPFEAVAAEIAARLGLVEGL